MWKPRTSFVCVRESPWKKQPEFKKIRSVDIRIRKTTVGTRYTVLYIVLNVQYWFLKMTVIWHHVVVRKVVSPMQCVPFTRVFDKNAPLTSKQCSGLSLPRFQVEHGILLREFAHHIIFTDSRFSWFLLQNFASMKSRATGFYLLSVPDHTIASTGMFRILYAKYTRSVRWFVHVPTHLLFA